MMNFLTDPEGMKVMFSLASLLVLPVDWQQILVQLLNNLVLTLQQWTEMKDNFE